MSGNGGRTRRELLVDAAKGAAVASVAGLSGCFPGVGGRWADAAPNAVCTYPDGGATGDAGAASAVTSAVVEVLRDDSVDRGTTMVVKPDVVAGMLDVGLTALAQQAKIFNARVLAPGAGGGADDSVDSGVDNPWKVLLPKYQPGMRIGLKVNCLGGQTATSPALVRAIIASLRDKLGVDPTTITVWDRGLDELQVAKYTPEDLAGATLLGTKTVTFTPTDTPGEPGYGDVISTAPQGIVKGGPGDWPRLSRILTEKTDLTINCPLLKRHSTSGFTAAMKNIYGFIDIPGQFHSNIVTALPRLFALPAVRNSISLTILDALVAVINRDTMDAADAVPKRIILGLDPVALDSYALALLNQLRAALPHPAAKSNDIDSSKTGWIAEAACLGLGNPNYTLIQA
jgi:uncharacterized protein (DUF362 family)